MSDDEALAVFLKIRSLEEENERLKIRVAELEAYEKEKMGLPESPYEIHLENPPTDEDRFWYTLSDDELRELCRPVQHQPIDIRRGRV